MKWYIYFSALCLSAFLFLGWGIHSDSPIIISCTAVVYLSFLLIWTGMFLNRRSPIPTGAIVLPWFLFYLLYAATQTDFTVRWKLIAYTVGLSLYLFLFVSFLYYKIKGKKKS